MTAKSRASSAPSSQAVDKVDRWKHDEGTPLEELEVGMWYEGHISNIGPNGVFVDFGAIRDALLRIPEKYRRALKSGQEVAVELIRVDLETNRMLVQMDKKDWPDIQEPSSGGSNAQAGKSKGKGRSGVWPKSDIDEHDTVDGYGHSRGSSRVPRNFRLQPGHHLRTPLENLEAGTIVQGTVKNVGSFGVFLDIGAQGDARIAKSSSKSKSFVRGQLVDDCHIDWVDTKLRRIQVSLPEESLKPGSGTAAPAKPPNGFDKDAKLMPAAISQGGKGSTKGSRGLSPKRDEPQRKGPQQAEEEDLQTGRHSLGGLKVGDRVDGHVLGKNYAGIVVDIGCNVDACLVVPSSIWSEIQKRDEIVGMRIEVIDPERQRVTLSIQDPELEHLPTAPVAHQEQLSSPFASCKVGAFVNGVVTRVTPTAIFVDIGLAQDAVLDAHPALKDMIREDDQIHGMKIDLVDLKADKLIVSVQDPTLETAERGPSPSRRAGSSPLRPPRNSKAAMAKTKAGAKRRAKIAANQEFHRGGTPLEELLVGEEFIGIVTKVDDRVHVDIGAVVDGQLNLAISDVKKFQLGDQVEGMLIEHVDITRHEVRLKLPYELGDLPVEAPLSLNVPRSRQHYVHT